MIVVSDTSPIFYLLEIGVVEILHTLYGEVLVPPAVHEELCHPSSPSCQWASRPPDWFRVVAPRHIDESIKLDRGEREAIALAIESQADRLLIDEKLGRQAAKQRGLQVAGTLGVLLDAGSVNLIDFEQAIHRLRQTTFYLTDALVEELRRELIRRRG